MKRLLLSFIILSCILPAGAQFDSIPVKKLLQKKLANPILETVDLSTRPTPPEPDYIYGYVAWVDPVTGRKHLRMGRNRTTLMWEYVLAYPTYTINFVNRSTGETRSMYFGASGAFQRTVDAAGNTTTDINRIVAYRYRFDFSFDRAFTGIPYSSSGTITYNPDTWRFENVEITNWGTPDNIEVPLEDYPVIPVRWTLRTIPFPDLPNF